MLPTSCVRRRKRKSAAGIDPRRSRQRRYQKWKRFRITPPIGVEEFNRVEMRAGTIIEAGPNKKARNPAYKLKIDFGPEIGVKSSSAQITELYTAEQLIGMQVICCTNLTPIHIGSVKSEVRILGTESEQGVVLLMPTAPVKNGDKVF